jgi:hypothetical protein
MKSNLLYLLFFLGCYTGYTQNPRQVLKGQVVAGYYTVKDVLVVNVNAEKETRTDSLGVFNLQAKPGDTLNFSHPDLKVRRMHLAEQHFKINPLVVYVALNNAYQMEEIIIAKNNNLTAEKLGIVPKGQKVYTPAERRLYTAGDFKPIHLVGLLFGSLQVDPIINAINGRTRTLKTEIITERKENALQMLNTLYNEDEIVAQYNIPAEYVNGFLYYIVEDNELATALKAKNETLVKFLMAGLSVKYLDLINNEIQPDDDK